MIVDQISKWKSYPCFSKIGAAFEFLAKATPDIANGDHKIDGDNIIVKVSEYTSKNEPDAFPEAHKVYADIQVLLSGAEYIQYMPVEGLTEKGPFEEKRDVGFYLKAPCSTIRLEPGLFALFMPQDAHAPCISINGPTKIKKVVIKVRKELIG